MTLVQGRLASVLTAGAVLIAVHAIPASAEATAGCAVAEAGAPGPAGDRLEVGFTEFVTIEIERTGQRIRVKSGDDEGLRLVPCGGPTATVDSVDSVVLTVQPEPLFETELGEELFADVVMDFQEGPLAPGATDEGDGGSEVELSIAGQAGAPVRPEVEVLGTPGPDSFAYGEPAPGSLNFNASEPLPDADFSGLGSEIPLFRGGDGDDLIRTSGGFAEMVGEKGNDQLIASVGAFASGGRGNDTLIGGVKGDLLLGGPGSDSISAGTGGDTAIGGPGTDLLDMGPQRDLAVTADRSRDRIRCGGGRDAAGIDRRDRRKGCERVEFLKGTPNLFD